jgi:DNA polymerase-4
LDLLDGAKHDRMNKALHAADKLRDKYGEGSVSLALGMKGRFKERTHDALPNDAMPKK